MPQASDLLIAPPHMTDKRFHKAVIMITHHNTGGTFGLCLNKPTEHTMQDILEETGIEGNVNFPLYWGGPVNPTTVWMLHDSGWECDGTVKINNEWSMTSNLAMFQHLADGDTPTNFRMFFGFSSWAQGQLKAELRGIEPWSHKHSWLVAENPGPEWIMETPVEDLWIASTDLCSHQAVDSWL